MKTEWWGAGVVICLERGAHFHMAQLIPLPLAVSCFSKIHIDFTILVPGSPGKRALKRVCVFHSAAAHAMGRGVVMFSGVRPSVRAFGAESEAFCDWLVGRLQASVAR